MGAEQSCVPSCSAVRFLGDVDTITIPEPMMTEMKEIKRKKEFAPPEKQEEQEDDSVFIKKKRPSSKRRRQKKRQLRRRGQMQDPMYYKAEELQVEVVQHRRQVRQGQVQVQLQNCQAQQEMKQRPKQEGGRAEYILRGFTTSGRDVMLEKPLPEGTEAFIGLHGSVLLHEGNLVSFTSLDGHRHKEVAFKAHEIKKTFPLGISYGGLKKSIWFEAGEERDRFFHAVQQTFQVYQGIRDEVIVNMYYGVSYTDINGVRYEGVKYEPEGLRKTFPMGISYGDLPRSIFFADEQERDLTFLLMSGRLENPTKVPAVPIVRSFDGLKHTVSVHTDGTISYVDISGMKQTAVTFDASRIKKTFPSGISYGDLPKSVFFKEEKTRDLCFDLMRAAVFEGLHGSVAVTKEGIVTYTDINGDRYEDIRYSPNSIKKTFPKGISYGGLPKSIFFADDSERDAVFLLMKRGEDLTTPTVVEKPKLAAPALSSLYAMQFKTPYTPKQQEKKVEETANSDFKEYKVAVVHATDCENENEADVAVQNVEQSAETPMIDYENILTDYKCYNYLLSGEENRVEVKIFKDLNQDILQKCAISPMLQPVLFGIDPKLQIQRVYEHGPDLVVVSEHVALSLKDVLTDNSFPRVSQLARMYITYELIKSVAELHETGIAIKLLSSLSVLISRDGRVTTSGFLDHAMMRLKTQIICANDDEPQEMNPLVLLKWRQRDVYRLGQLIARLFVPNDVLQWVKDRLDLPTEFDSYPDVKMVLHQKNVPKSVAQIICRCLRTKREGTLVHVGMNEILNYAHYGICKEFDMEAGRQDLVQYLAHEYERLTEPML